MKNKMAAFLALCFLSVSIARGYTEVNYQIYYKSWKQISKYIASVQNGDSLHINKLSLVESDLEAGLDCSAGRSGYLQLNTHLLTLGEVRTTTITSPEVDTVELNVKREELINRIGNIENLIKKENWNNRITDSLYRELRDERIRLAEAESKMNAKYWPYRITVRFLQRHSRDSDESQWFNFVNMPGLETRMLVVENGGSEKFRKTYYGGGLKWRYTQGASHFDLGILKEMKPDTAKQADLLYLGIGHEFYPTFVQRTDSDFFNLFTGFNYGVMYVNGGSHFSFFYICPQVGMDWINTSKVSLISYAGYLVPLNPKLSFYWRGLELSTSLNFLF